MIFSRVSSLATMATLVPLVLGAKLDRPVIDPAFDRGLSSLNPKLMEHYPPTNSTHDQWGAGWIPEWCKTVAGREKVSPFDFEVFNVHYTDCGDVWIMCRHKESPASQETMIDTFGRMPVRMRSHVRHVAALPGRGSAYNDNNNIAFFGATPSSISVVVHEIGHSLDGNAYSQGHPFHNTKEWLDAYKKDTAVADDYAKTNQGENHSQETVVAMFNAAVPGGLQTINTGWKQIFNQYDTIQKYAGDTIKQGGTCEKRLTNDAPIPMAPGRIFSAFKYITGDKPDIGLAIADVLEVARSEFDHVDVFDEIGNFLGTRKR